MSLSNTKTEKDFANQNAVFQIIDITFVQQKQRKVTLKCIGFIKSTHYVTYHSCDIRIILFIL